MRPRHDVSRVSLWNATLLLVAVGASMWMTWNLSLRSSVPSAGAESELQGFVVDADGARVPARAYSRIASASTIADQVLIRILDPSRLIAVSRHSQRGPDDAWRYEGKAGIGRADDLEAIIEMRPDLVFINGFVDVRQVERMKEAGLVVFNLGEMRGLDTLLPNIRGVAAVVGRPRRGEVLASEFERRLRSVSAGVPDTEKRRALYVGIHGDRLYGGTEGTSFHDVLDAGGLIDVAAEAGFRDWPAYTSEQLLNLDPPWIITNDRSEDALCRHPGFDALAACENERVRGIDTDLLTDPGLGMLRAAEAIHDAVYR
ncbi:MAG: ABC transporter substrate-binding protein [Polyangiales bacterium]